MNYTGQELVDKKIITGPIGKDNIQQHGVDLNLVAVKRVLGEGFIPNDITNGGKTILATREPVCSEWIDFKGEQIQVWKLGCGVYDITFEQGCVIPNDVSLEIVHRSSLFRNGVILVSALFDAGFKTNQIGTVMTVNVPIVIQFGARIGQAYTMRSNEVKNLYNGQWQGDKQREEDLKKDH